jgi:hypothetical protein
MKGSSVMERLIVSDTEWIDVRSHLKVRDRRDIHTHSVDGMATDGLTYRFNVVKHQIASAAVRIGAWSLPLPWPTTFKDRVAAIEDLDEDVFGRISKALEAFEAAHRAEEEQAKNATADGGTA